MKYLFKIVPAVALLALAGVAMGADTDRLRTQTRYDQEYPVVDYSGPATHNRIWRLQQRLDKGELKLAWEPKFGYLRSLLKALEIDADSQVLVFSRTSLQIEHISAHTPRSVFFNDDTYVGYVQDTPLIELTAIDDDKGAVFYAFDNRRESQPLTMGREGSRCLSCHDTYSMMGGGVPRVVVMSAPVDDVSDPRTFTSAEEVDDRTPLEARWGGWYVTGRTGTQAHLGNFALRDERGGERLRELGGSRTDLATVKAYIDSTRYLTDRSDVVALMVLEHQTYVQNLITRVSYKVRTLMAAQGGEPATEHWVDLPEDVQKRMKAMIEPLVKAMFFHDAAPFAHVITGNSGFTQRFAKLGPHDAQGRGLRDFDLQQRLFRYPLSFTIYSPQVDALPPYALDYLHERIAEVVDGRDTTGISQRISAEDRAVIGQIIAQTKPVLAARLATGGVAAAR